jgi:hypothetical protein
MDLINETQPSRFRCFAATIAHLPKASAALLGVDTVDLDALDVEL